MQQNTKGFRSQCSRVKETEHRLISINAIRKSFSGPNHGWFQELQHDMKYSSSYTQKEKWECQILVRWYNIKHGHLPNDTSRDISKGQHGLRHICNKEQRVLSTLKNFTLPKTPSRVPGDTQCFSVTCDWITQWNKCQLTHPAQQQGYLWTL